jgi:hypothetical protein
LKLNSTGGVTWQKTYGGTSDEYAYCIRQTPYGGYIVAGTTDSFGAGGDDVWVLKLDPTGSLVWDAGSGASTQATSVVPSDSNAAVSTTSVSPADTSATPIEDTADLWQFSTQATVYVQSTPDTTPPAAITDLTASNPTSTSVTLEWTAPGDDGMTGNATGYLVKYSTVGSAAINWASATTYSQIWIPAKNGTGETHNVTGLNPSTKYWFAIEACDEVPNYAAVSNSPSATTTASTTTTSTVTTSTSSTGSTTSTAPSGLGTSTMLLIVGGVAVVIIVAAVLMAKRKR